MNVLVKQQRELKKCREDVVRIASRPDLPSSYFCQLLKLHHRLGKKLAIVNHLLRESK